MAREGLRREGLLSAVFAFVEKMAYAFTPLVTGILLKLTGYVQGKGGTLEQPPDAILGIRLGMALVPAGMALLGLVFLRFYHLDAARLKAETGTDALHTRVFNQEMQETHRTSMIREGEWKLILSETRAPELYHLPGRSHEMKNLAEDKGSAGVRRDLEAKLGKWWKW